MFTLITCPTCQHKFTVPEAAMGKRHSCPHCQSLFMAGKSTAEPEVPMKQSAPAGPAETPINKTMLGETEPPIKYNCPRCKKPLESPAIEALTKKPCPHCGQRLQVPKAPAPAVPPLNKTMLASDEGVPQSTGVQAQPSASAPAASMPVSALATTTVPAGQTPAAALPFGLSSKVYMIGGIVGGGFLFLVLLACVLTMATGGGAKAEKDKFEAAQKELDNLRTEIKKRELDMEKQRQAEADYERERRKLKDKQDDDQREFDRRMRAIQADDSLKAADKLQREQQLKAEQAAREREKLDADQRLRDLEARLKQQADDNRRAQEAANQRATTIIQAAPPPYYYRYHPYYGWGY